MTVQVIRPNTVATPTPDKRKGGLLDVADVRQGIAWLDPDGLGPSWNCVLGHGGAMCHTDPRPSKTFDSPSDMGGVEFFVYVGGECKPLGGDTEAQVSRIFDVQESTLVETEYEAAVLDGLTDEGTGTAVEGLAALDYYMAQNYVGMPVFHVGLLVAYALMEDRLLIRNDDGTFITKMGAPVVVGSGYDPNLLAVTGAVVVYQGEKMLMPAMDMAQNNDRALAERPYIVYTDCGGAKFTVEAP